MIIQRLECRRVKSAYNFGDASGSSSYERVRRRHSRFSAITHLADLGGGRYQIKKETVPFSAQTR
jgi:hypothetical protein